MKYRIIGTILVLIVLGALFVVTNQDDTQHTNLPTQQQTDPDANALKGLKIN